MYCAIQVSLFNATKIIFTNFAFKWQLSQKRTFKSHEGKKSVKFVDSFTYHSWYGNESTCAEKKSNPRIVLKTTPHLVVSYKVIFSITWHLT